jgi:hypothetical protein
MHLILFKDLNAALLETVLKLLAVITSYAARGAAKWRFNSYNQPSIATSCEYSIL